MYVQVLRRAESNDLSKLHMYITTTYTYVVRAPALRNSAYLGLLQLWRLRMY